jgi:hypothetical protein
MSGFKFTLWQVLPDGTWFALAQGTLAFCVAEQSAYISKGVLASNLIIE